MKTYFISGHVDITEEQWNQNYKSLIDNAISENAHFVVGDSSKGADKLSINYLYKIGFPRTRVIIFHMHKKARYNPDSYFATLGGFKNDEERDTAMTLNSEIDIAWAAEAAERQEAETKLLYWKKYQSNKISGTQKNLDRRTTINQLN